MVRLAIAFFAAASIALPATDWREDQRQQILNYLDGRIRVARAQRPPATREGVAKLLGLEDHGAVQVSMAGSDMLLTFADGLTARARLHRAATPSRLAVVMPPAAVDVNALVSSGVTVAVMETVPRNAEHPLCRKLKDIDARRLLHRQAFLVGRTLPGLEASQAAAVARELQSAQGLPVDLYGGWTALITAATHPLFAAVRVNRDFGDDAAAEPLDRMVYGQELAFGNVDLERLAKAEISSATPALLPAATPGRMFDELHAFVRKHIDASQAKREDYWKLRSSGQKASALRQELEQWMGVPKSPTPAAQPTLKLIRITSHFKAWEVRLPVAGGMEAVGHLLVPRTGSRMPAVITQHGLDGQPKDITGVGEEPNAVYHEFGGRLAERGYVVFAPYLTVPKPQLSMVNPIVRKAAAVGMLRTAVEVIKLRRIVDFLETRPEVDPQRIGYYGLSYGGYSAIWMGSMEPRLKAVIVSGHFNDWTAKVTSEDLSICYLFHPDEDFFNWNVLNRFTHVELIAAMHPRPVMVEFAEGDTTTTPEWHERAWQQVLILARAWNMEQKWVRDRFLGVHEIGGMRAFEFLDQWLKPESGSSRSYSYRLSPSMRDLPGLADSAADTYPYIESKLGPQPLRDTFHVGTAGPTFTGMRLRLSRSNSPSPVVVKYGSKEGANDLGEVRIDPGSVLPLFDLWYEARVPARRLVPGVRYHVEVHAPQGEVVIYGPKPLGGTPLPHAFPFAYELLSSNRRAGEPAFEFVREYLSPPPKATTPALQFASNITDPAVVQAVDRFPRSAAAGAKRVHLELSPVVDGVNTAEGFRAEVKGETTTIRATTARGVMRGLYWLEDAHAMPRSLVSTLRNERFARRITTSILPGGLRYSETTRPFLYTDGLLQRISRDGFNGIWIWLNTEDAAFGSALFPELDDPEAPERLRRIQDLTERAARYGIDVYVYLGTGYRKFIPDSFYSKYPELRGVGFGNAMCTSDARARRYHAEIVRNLFRTAPGIRGMVIIYDHEGFYYCGNTEKSRERCPRCRHRTNVDLATEVITNLNNAVREAGRPESEFIAWSYGTENWVDQVIPNLPKNVKVQVDFSKGGTVVRDGITHQTGDYNLTLIGPPDFFDRRNRMAKELGLDFLTKTEHAVSQEFIFVPYIPAMEQWLRRVNKIREYPAAGWFGNWSHYGYMAPLPARLINRMSFDPAPPGREVLEELSSIMYGATASPLVLKAWDEFSEAIRQFPYSDHVARLPGPLQKGPSQPFFLDPAVKNFGRWRSWQNDLAWTAPWGPEVAAKYLGVVRDGFRRGAALLQRAEAAASTAANRKAIAAEWRIARTIEASLTSTLHQIEWLTLREKFVKGQDRAVVSKRMSALLQAELANVRAILPILDADSRLGYASEGGGVLRGGLFSPDLVRWKIGQVEDVLDRQIPQSSAGTRRLD